MEPNELEPSSPTISSLSSSDLDTESTGSFFHDRSTTLGTLMGVSFAGRVSAHGPDDRRIKPQNAQRRRKNMKHQHQQQQGKCWWRLCRDNSSYRSVNNPSLGDFLAVERRSGTGESSPGNLFDEFQVVGRGENGRLFEDGRVLPPALAAEAAAALAAPPGQSMGGGGSGIGRLPDLLNGILCNNGGRAY